MENSAPGQYAQDRSNVLAGQRALAAKVKANLAAPPPFPGVDTIELTEGKRRGIEYHALLSNTAQGSGQIIFLVPRHDIIVTAYVLGRMASAQGWLLLGLKPPESGASN